MARHSEASSTVSKVETGNCQYVCLFARSVWSDADFVGIRPRRTRPSTIELSLQRHGQLHPSGSSRRMDLEANALVGQNIVGDMKILDHVDFVDQFDLIGVINTQVLVEDTDNGCLPKRLPDLVLYYNLYEKVYSPRKAKKDKGTPLYFSRYV